MSNERAEAACKEMSNHLDMHEYDSVQLHRCSLNMIKESLPLAAPEQRATLRELLKTLQHQVSETRAECDEILRDVTEQLRRYPENSTDK